MIITHYLICGGFAKHYTRMPALLSKKGTIIVTAAIAVFGLVLGILGFVAAGKPHSPSVDLSTASIISILKRSLSLVHVFSVDEVKSKFTMLSELVQKGEPVVVVGPGEAFHDKEIAKLLVMLYVRNIHTDIPEKRLAIERQIKNIVSLSSCDLAVFGVYKPCKNLVNLFSYCTTKISKDTIYNIERSVNAWIQRSNAILERYLILSR